jgi:nicotinamide-nucleotide amidase
MPASNAIQADFPEGSRVIPNSEGTAPGIDLTIDVANAKCRFFCLPGVPAEMQGMWHDYVAPAILTMGDKARFIEQRVINCFGAGESQIESMLPGMIVRGRQPRVGITASMATISLRISASSESPEECRILADRDEAAIRDSLGDLVFGFAEQTLEQVLIERLVSMNTTLAVCDFGLSGQVAQSLASADPAGKAFRGGIFAFVGDDDKISFQRMQPDPGSQMTDPIVLAARNCRVEFDAELGLAIGPIDHSDGASQEFKVAIVGDDFEYVEHLRHVGHSGLRLQRSVRQVLNFARLRLV